VCGFHRVIPRRSEISRDQASPAQPTAALSLEATGYA